MGRRFPAVLSVSLFLTACTGDQGPMGPEGPPGPPGPGAASIVMAGALDGEGIERIHLPPAAGTIARPPNVACYTTGDPASGLYTIVAVDRVRRLDDEGEATFPLLEGCFLGQHLDHVDVFIVSIPDGSFIIVATPTV
ncbi:MAG: hypothetical protein OYK82_00090 [Gammaproteobacteria bacterium]|nr:hypothetical protein [Gammaproteobacteria bacterium]